MENLISRGESTKKLREYAEQKHSCGEPELANGILKAACFLENEDNISTFNHTKELIKIIIAKLGYYEDERDSGMCVLESEDIYNRTGKRGMFRWIDISRHGSPRLHYELISNDEEKIQKYLLGEQLANLLRQGAFDKEEKINNIMEDCYSLQETDTLKVTEFGKDKDFTLYIKKIANEHDMYNIGTKCGDIWIDDISSVYIADVYKELERIYDHIDLAYR